MRPRTCRARVALTGLPSLLLGLLFGLLAVPAQAQDPLRPDLPPAPPANVATDTARSIRRPSPAAQRAQAAADSALRTERLFGLRLTRPGKATLLAAILPGAGQVYNKSWWKLPIVYAGLGTVGYLEYNYQSLFREYSDAYNAVVAGKLPLRNPNLGTHAKEELTVEALNTRIVTYRRQRDIFILYCGLAYGIQILDALVDAHLKDFDVGDDLSLHWEPSLLPAPGAAVPVVPGMVVALRVK